MNLLCAKIYLAPFVGINLPTSFHGHCVLRKELNTDFSLLTKVCQFSVVQSTTNWYHHICTISLLSHSDILRACSSYLEATSVQPCRQGGGDTHCHIVGSHTQNNRTVPFCISICTLCMTPICLVHLLSCATLSYTMYSLHNIPQFSKLLHCTLRPSLYECRTCKVRSFTNVFLAIIWFAEHNINNYLEIFRLFGVHYIMLCYARLFFNVGR